MSIEDMIAYAQRGRGERKRPASGWASLTPTELDVVRIVGEGVFWYNTPNGLMSLQGVPTAAGAEDGMPSKNRSLRMAVLDEFDV